MEFIAQKKSWWIILGQVKRAGVADSGDSISYNGDILTFEDIDSWKSALKENDIDPKNIIQKAKLINPSRTESPAYQPRPQIRR